MKKSIVKISLMALSCVAAFIFASCSTDVKEGKGIYQGYFTITGTHPNYKLIDDGGRVFYPTPYSVNKITDGKGFGSNKRAIIVFSYDEKDVTEINGVFNVHNAEITSGNYLIEVTPITLETAKDKNINATDSVFSIGGFTNYWVSNGYLTTVFYAPVSYAPDYLTTGNLIEPTINLCTDEITENNVTLHFLYNRHTKKDAMSTNVPNLVYTFDIANINIPGTDSIKVTLKSEGPKDITFKVARKNLSYPL